MCTLVVDINRFHPLYNQSREERERERERMDGELHTSFSVSRARERSSRVLLLLVVLLLADESRYGMGVTAENLPMVLPGCLEHCGNGVLIPYPFGIGRNCSRQYGCNQGNCSNFIVRCADNRPFLFVADPLFGFSYLREQDPYEVIEISLKTHEVTVLIPVSPLCNGSRQSYRIPECCTLSGTRNKLTTVGCNAFGALTFSYPSDITWVPGIGCLAACENETDRVLVDDSCSGFGCCQTSIPQGVTGLTHTYNKVARQTLFPWLPSSKWSCGYAFLTEASNYTFKRSHLSWSGNKSFPVVLDFAILDDDTCVKAQSETTTYACKSNNSECRDGNYSRVFSTPYDSYTCFCSPGYEGNPYLHDGCQDINECHEPDKYPCNGTCVNTPGSHECHSAKRSKPVTIIAIPTTIATFLFLVTTSICIYSFTQRKKYYKQKERYFLQNGGLILQSQISHTGVQNSFKIFSKEEIDKATNHFDQSQVIGRGGNGVVFKGKLSNDDRDFAIKKSILLDGSRVEEFINELLILSQINHRNIVRLLGCCLEVEEPLLVYEYIPNGTLSHNIHQGNLPWEIRLKIAIEAADALSHLHFKINIPIIHRDVKSSNILIDDDYTAKVSDFGASKMIPSNELQITTLVQGTLGYLDPEYIQSNQLTDKSDVYSFGVVLLELITGKLPFSSQRSEEEKSLAAMFISYMKRKKLGDLLDERIVSASIMDQLEDVANLALQCLSLSGVERPTMKEVVQHLELIKKNEHLPQIYYYTEQQNIPGEIATTNNNISTCVEDEQTTRLLEVEMT